MRPLHHHADLAGLEKLVRFVFYKGARLEGPRYNLGYLKGTAGLTRFQWNDMAAALTIQHENAKTYYRASATRSLRIEILPEGIVKSVEYIGKPIKVNFSQK